MGNARYWVLKLLIEEFAPGDALVSTQCAEGMGTQELSCMGAITKSGAHKLLIVNHLNEVQSVKMNGFPAGEAQLRIVDPKSVQAASSSGIRNATMEPADSLELQPFAVVVVLGGGHYGHSPLLTFI